MSSMNSVAVRALKPNVRREEAVRAFSGAGFSTWYWRMRSGPLRRIAEAYVPYFLFRVKYAGAPARLFAIDAVNGSLDLFEFPHIPVERELLAVEGRNRLKAAMTQDRAIELLRDKVLRVIFQQGFFKLRDAHLDITPAGGELYLPYWLGFHERGGAVHCRVMDAVRRRMEGAKACLFFEQWLAA